ncbi:hypothetical protein CJP74_07370 [Psittacicella melopsittaci]|uniref:Cytosol non-specific dipeptidase n=1 Tax=Psittacicella melopsittaci TaxID=2028576 RepID=A0A3A1Y1V8_9GAMM|nr:aminoacyl-histidine dipeptidase [Psittacicella melopsittaci]RIY31400.1 hypothetical protein CJP74_07370 [Psittacicella melopsittaci]
MKATITDLKPQLLWKWFDTICSIPHPSYHDQALVDYIYNWAQEKNLWVEKDQAGNLLIRKPATPGYENVPSIAFQAHVDMVPQADSHKQHDFLKDPITTVINGEYLYADNTTLGADNGIGVASILALLEDDSIEHGPIEGLLTRNEEVGMEGVLGLAENWLESQYLVNTDTEEWGHLYLGCAGGIDLSFHKEYNFKPLKDGAKVFKISLKGFRGGHSGVDIHTNRESAIKYLSKLLFALYREVKFNFVDLYAGQARNAIPREAYATVSVTAENESKFVQAFAEVQEKLTSIFKLAEPNGSYSLDQLEATPELTRLSCSDMPNLLNFLVLVPNGVLRNSDEFAGVVETSQSGGVLRLNPEEGFKYQILARSLNDTANKIYSDEMFALADLTGIGLTASGFYSGWTPSLNEFTKFVEEEYKKATKSDIEVKVMHAGLECGILQGHYPDIKIVSIGPDIHNPHTPKERVHIGSVEKYYNLLVSILKNFKSAQNV